MITESFNISGVDTNESHLFDVYSLEHHSEVGIKYVSSSTDIKITYSDRIVNFVNGRWRMSLNRSPFTSYYANPATTDSIPVTGWVDLEGNIFTGSVYIIEEQTTQQPSTEEPDTVEPVPLTGDTIESTPAQEDTTESTVISSPPSQVLIPAITGDRGDMYSNALTETVKVYGRPTITFLSHNNIMMGSKYAVLVTGYSLQYTTNVYLSSNADMFEHKLINTHDDDEYPPISACETSFDTVSENEIIINIPAVYKTGMIDIIISNPAGYGKLTPVYESISDNWTEENLQPYIITVDL